MPCQLHAYNTLTRAIAGPRPLHRARTPSCAIVFRAQSMNPEYVPVGADWIRDLRTCITSCQHQKAPEQQKSLTSGGIAIDHIAMPAMPPATMTAPRFRSDGDDPTGVNARFVTSYAAKYLARIRLGDRAEESSRHLRSAAGPVSRYGRERPAEDAPQAALAVQVSHYVGDALVLGSIGGLALHLSSVRFVNAQHETDVTALTCSRTFARSTGAVISVVGTAEKKPAAASSGIDNSLLTRFGVSLRMSSFEVSYACA